MTKKSHARVARDQMEKDRDHNAKTMIETHKDVMGLLNTPSDVLRLLQDPMIQKNIDNQEHVASLVNTLASDISKLRDRAEANKQEAAALIAKPKFENGDSMGFINCFETFQDITTVFTLNVTPIMQELMDNINVAASKANQEMEATKTEEVIKVESCVF
jgi:hypothetical protein